MPITNQQQTYDNLGVYRSHLLDNTANNSMQTDGSSAAAADAEGYVRNPDGQ